MNQIMRRSEIRNKIQHELKSLSEEQLEVIYEVVKTLKNATKEDDNKQHRDLPMIDEIDTVKRQTEQHLWKNTDNASLS